MPAPNPERRVGKTHRSALIAKLHIAKKQLGLDDETYRDMLENLTGKRSAKDLSDRHLAAVIEDLKQRGFKPLPKARPKRPRPSKDRARALAKVKALWISLHHLGVLRDPSDDALDAMARRVTGGKAKGAPVLEWLDGDGLYKLTEALKKMAEREAGVDWSGYQKFVPGVGTVVIYRPRCRVIEAQWRLIEALGLVGAASQLQLMTIISQAAGRDETVTFDELTDDEQDAAIVALGKMVRLQLQRLGHATLADFKEATGWAR